MSRLVQARIPDELADWVDEHFPHGYKQRFIEDCFIQLHELVEGGRLPDPGIYPKAAALRAAEVFNR